MKRIYDVTLTYFKPTGKYYAEGKHATTKGAMWQLQDEVEKMRDERRLPGVAGSEYIISVTVEATHPNEYPLLILPKWLRQLAIEHLDKEANGG